jgi:hypothetical protein
LARRNPPLSNCLPPPPQAKGSVRSIVLSTNELLILACCQGPDCVRGQVRPAQRIPFQRPCPCRTAVIHQAPGELAHHENAVGVPDSSLGLRSNATIPQAVRSPSSCTLKGVPERSSCRAMCLSCTAFSVRMLWGPWSRGFAGLNPWLGSSIPSGCFSRPDGPRATTRRSRYGRAARVPIPGRGAPLALSGEGWRAPCPDGRTKRGARRWIWTLPGAAASSRVSEKCQK